MSIAQNIIRMIPFQITYLFLIQQQPSSEDNPTFTLTFKIVTATFKQGASKKTAIFNS